MQMTASPTHTANASTANTSAAMPKAKVPSSRFWDRVAARYAKKSVDDEVAYEIKLRKTQTYLRPEMNVLEFGCGTGSTALIHSPYVKHILATDISAKMLEFANCKAQAQNITNVEFRQSTLAGINAPPQSYDAVLGLNILHLVKDRDAAIAEAFRVLKPGGFFVSSTVCLGERMGYFRFIAPIGKFLGAFPILRVFRISQLVESIERAGFVIDHEWTSGEPKSQSVFLIAKKP